MESSFRYDLCPQHTYVETRKSTFLGCKDRVSRGFLEAWMRVSPCLAGTEKRGGRVVNWEVSLEEVYIYRSLRLYRIWQRFENI